MCEIAPLAGLKRRAKTAGSDAFSSIWRTNERRGISVSRPHFEGTDQQNGHQVAESGGNKGQFSYFVEANCHDFRLHDKVELRNGYTQNVGLSFCC